MESSTSISSSTSTSWMGRVVAGVYTGGATPVVLWSHLAPTVRPIHLMTFYIAVLMTIASYTFVNSAARLVLADILKIEDNLGTAAGDLGFYSEILIICAVTPWGVLSDKIGRNAVYALAFVFMALGFGLTSYASSYLALVMYRLIYALGAAAAAAMLTTVMADYVVYKDKGTASGFMGLFSGCGALFAALLLLRIPELVGSDDTVKNINVMYLVTMSIVACTAVFVFFNLQGRTAIQRQNKEVLPLRLLAEGFTAAWKDPRLALGYLGGFAARGDAVVLTTFLSLWVQETVRQQGGDSEEAAAAAGMITGIAQTFAMVFSIFAGIISTRLNAMLALLLMSMTAVLGYGGICFTDDPTSMYAILCASVIGVGEIGVIVAAQALTSKRAPAAVRGSVGGTFGLSGSIGVLICNKVGGILYDMDPTGPFLLFACVNLFVALCSVLVMWGTGSTSFWSDIDPADSDPATADAAYKPLIANAASPSEVINQDADDVDTKA